MTLIGSFQGAHKSCEKEDRSLGKMWRSRTADDGGNRKFVDRMAPSTEILYEAEKCDFLRGMGRFASDTLSFPWLTWGAKFISLLLTS